MRTIQGNVITGTLPRYAGDALVRLFTAVADNHLAVTHAAAVVQAVLLLLLLLLLLAAFDASKP